MSLVDLRVLALYERLLRENRLLLALLRAGYTLAEAEEALRYGPQLPGPLLPAFGRRGMKGVEGYPHQGVRRIVV